MSKFIDEAYSKFGRIDEDTMMEFKAIMMPFFHSVGFSEEEVDMRPSEYDDWWVDVFTPKKGTERTMQSAGQKFYCSIGGQKGDFSVMVYNKDRNKYFWLIVPTNLPPGIVEARTKDDAQYRKELNLLLEGIKAGRLKSKSPDGYLVLAGEFYDAIEAGKKKVEYRDFTENNLKRTIGIKTIRFNRGYGSKGKPPKQMRWEVKRVALVDDENEECNPMKVPEDFWPTTIAIHLGKRLD